MVLDALMQEAQELSTTRTSRHSCTRFVPMKREAVASAINPKSSNTTAGNNFSQHAPEDMVVN